jgi:hypothetical protein
MLQLAESTDIRVVERAYAEEDDDEGNKKRVYARGTYDYKTKILSVGRRKHRTIAKADDLILTTIHELLHAATGQNVSERWVAKHDLEFYKMPELREKVAVRLLNILLFPETES